MSNCRVPKEFELRALQDRCAEWRAAGRKIVFTNGCYDVLHAGHIQLLQTARTFGDVLIVGLNSDDSVRRLKGPQRPINGQTARAFVMGALECVDAVVVFPEDTPVETIAALQPDVHVKGGDYVPETLPEAATVLSYGGAIEIVPLRDGFSTTNTLKKLADSNAPDSADAMVGKTSPAGRAVIIIPARWGSTRFPGKPLADLEGRTVIERVVEASLKTNAARPVLVATDDDRIAAAVKAAFPEDVAAVVMTSTECATGTDRLAEALRTRFSEQEREGLIVINVQGDEPFINFAHVDALIEAMKFDSGLDMATLATPITDEAQIRDPNVVKAVAAINGDALYFSRHSIPFERDANPESAFTKLRHLGVYAYRAKWLLEMAQLPPSPLEQKEKLEQLRALENGRRIRLIVIEDVINIAIDTPDDLLAAQEYWRSQLEKAGL